MTKYSVFELEKLREELASKKKWKNFLETYNLQHQHIPNLNTELFWDHLNTEYSDTSEYVKDRLKIVSSFIKPGSSVLNIGFGSLSLEKQILNNSRHLNTNWTGIDLSKQSVTIARKLFNRHKFFHNNILHNSIGGKSEYDTVVAMEVLEHIPTNKLLQTLHKIYSVCRRRGKLIVSVPMNENLHIMLERGQNPNGHLRAYTPMILSSELKLSGFKPIIIKELFAFKTGYKFKKAINNIIRLKRNPNNLIIVAEKV